MKYLLILLGRVFLTLKDAVINIYKKSVKTIFYKTNIQDTNIIENMF